MSDDALAQHRQAYAYCAYCPKICRFSCPVSEATHTETTSTWGKMTQAFLVAEKGQTPTAESAQAMAACTGCMRCRSFCKHENEVGLALFAARGPALQAGVAPKGAASTVKTFTEHGNPFGKDLGPLVSNYRAEGPVRFPMFAGCSALAKRPEVIEDALVVSRELGAPFGVCRASTRCCGYPLYAAGDTDAFRVHAEKVAEALKPYPELVVLDPGCAYTLKVVYPRVGVELGGSIRTVYEVLSERIDHAADRPPLELTVGYHDACHLGRGLGQYEEPRSLLRAAVREVREARDNRSEAGCSGGGGLLPRTMTDTSVEVARRQAEAIGSDANGSGAAPVVTACPTSRRMFERAGRPAEDLLAVLRRWLQAPRTGEGG